MPKSNRASTIIVVQDHKFLILRRSKTARTGPGFWNFPGGSVEAGESLEQAGVRELKEEANLDVKESDLFYLGYLDRKYLKVHFYITDQFDGEVKINDESDQYQWVTIDQINNYLFIGNGTLEPAIIEAIDEYIGE